MKLLRPISLLAGLLMTMTGAAAQVSLTAPAAQPPASPPAAKKEAPKPKAPTAAKKPAATPTPPPAAPLKPSVTTRPAPAPSSSSEMPTFDDPNVDNVYGAYQRGLYKTAFDLAITRAQYNRDAKAMTMLGELYANALGIKRDYAKAADWYQRAADAGDR
ncbi:MAG: SEL1-like repeat protein, partial [Bradyrhizobium sp.]|nr:SEL1-like repeat protein [Bradyrhizobium sp.]